MPFDTFLKQHGIPYTVCRPSMNNRVEVGLPDSGHISFMPGADIQAGDTLVNPSGDTYRIMRVETEYINKTPHFTKAFYQAENSGVQTVFNIQNAYGSVIGNNNSVNYISALEDLKQRISVETSPDKKDMEKIASLLEMIVNEQIKPSKGLFSKFSEVMERHSWLSSSVAGAILSWLQMKIP